MMETTANQSDQPQQRQTATENYSDPVEDRWRCLATVLLVGALLAILFIGLARGQAPIATGEARVNRLGDLVKISDEAEVILGKHRERVLFTDVFALVPPERREQARKKFASGWETMGAMPTVSFPYRGRSLTIEFTKADETRADAKLTWR